MPIINRLFVYPTDFGLAPRDSETIQRNKAPAAEPSRATERGRTSERARDSNGNDRGSCEMREERERELSSKDGAHRISGNYPDVDDETVVVYTIAT